MLITVRNFTGKASSIEVDPKSTIEDVKASIPQTGKNKAGSNISTVLAFKGHELRDHQLVAHYGIAKGDTLHILPPSREPKITLQFEIALGDESDSFALSVKPNITVAQLKSEISVEQAVEVFQLKFVSTVEDSGSEGDDLNITTLQELHDDDPVKKYQNEVIIVYTQSHQITVSSGSTEVTLNVQPSHPISQLRKLLSRNREFPPPSMDLSFVRNNETLDESRTFVDYKIPSGASLDLTVPSQFTVQLAVEDDGHKRRIDIAVTPQQTLADFREIVLVKHLLPLSEDVLILLGREVVGEDKTLKELGFTPNCTIHAVGYLSFNVESWFKTFDTMIKHPLTRLSTLRPQLQADVPDVPLEAFTFTLDGTMHLNESRTLWDLGIVSGCSLALRTRGFILSVKVITPGAKIFDIDVEEEETVLELKERLEGKAGISAARQKLVIRGKQLQDHETLKQHQLVGGETLYVVHSFDTNRFDRPSAPGMSPISEARMSSHGHKKYASYGNVYSDDFQTAAGAVGLSYDEMHQLQEALILSTIDSDEQSAAQNDETMRWIDNVNGLKNAQDAQDTNLVQPECSGGNSEEADIRREPGTLSHADLENGTEEFLRSIGASSWVMDNNGQTRYVPGDLSVEEPWREPGSRDIELEPEVVDADLPSGTEKAIPVDPPAYEK